MKHYTKLALSTFLVFELFIASCGQTEAQYYSQEQITGNVVIDKKVRPIDDIKFKDNIDASQKLFSTNDVLEFEIYTENTGKTVLYDLKIKDTLPKYLSLIYFPGAYDAGTGSINWTLSKLDIGETKTYFIRAKVSGVPSSNSKGIKINQTNKVCVTGADIAGDCDYSTYYVQKGFIPTTGVNDMWYKTLASLVIALMSIRLRRIARGY